MTPPQIPHTVITFSGSWAPLVFATIAPRRGRRPRGGECAP